MNHNLAKNFLDQHTARQSKTAFVDQHGSITFGQLTERSQQLAQWLIDHGMKPNDPVMFFLYDRVTTVIAFLAVVYAGGIPVLGNARARTTTHNKQVEIIRPKIMLVESEYKSDCVAQTYNIDIAIQQSLSMTPLLDAAVKEYDDVAFIGWTSGTTGYFKAVQLSHGRHLQLIKNVSASMRHSDQDKIYCTSKMFFLWGLNTTMFNVLWNGGEAYLDEGLAVGYRVQKIINQYQPNKFIGVPVVYSQLLELGQLTRDPVVYWSAGDRLPQLVIDKFFEQTGRTIYNSYGTTEMAGPLTNNQTGGNSIGHAVVGWKTRVVDENEQLVAANTIGQLQIKSQLQAIGYWQQEPFADAWMSSNDLAWQDDHGDLHYVCRVGDKIKINGQYVSPGVIEEVIQSHPDVFEVAVVVRPDKYDIDQIEAFVVLIQGATATSRQIKNWAKTHCEHNLCPRIINIVTQLPHTDTGKIQRYLLRKKNEEIINYVS